MPPEAARDGGASGPGGPGPAPGTGGPVVVAEFRQSHTTGGGPEKTILFSAAAHDPARVRVIPIYLAAPGDPLEGVEEVARRAGVEIVRVADRARLDPFVIGWMRRLLIRHRCRVLHTHDFKTDFLGLVLARTVPGLRLMATAHGWSSPLGKWHRFYNALDRRVLRLYPTVIAVSEHTARELRGVGFRRERLEILPNAIDVEQWRPRTRGALPPGLPSGRRFVGTVGRLSIDKDVPTLIRAFTQIAPAHPDLDLVLVGDGPERASLLALAGELGVRSRVHFLGQRGDLQELYGAFEVFVLSSRTEGMPNTLLEAMAMERPIVATPVGGVGEMVRDGEEALLVPPGDPAALAGAIALLCDRPERADELARSARARAVSRFSFTHRLRRIEEIYVRVAAGLPPGHEELQ